MKQSVSRETLGEREVILMIELIYNGRYVNKFTHPFHGTECHVYQKNKSYYYTDSSENHKEMHYICKNTEDYFDALADIFF